MTGELYSEPRMEQRGVTDVEVSAMLEKAAAFEPYVVEGRLMIHERLNQLLAEPLEAGGDVLAPFAKGIGEIDGEFLKVVIQPWLTEKLRIGAGSLVIVDNANGKFTITRSGQRRASPMTAAAALSRIYASCREADT
jgi:hypothetical protein